MVRVTGIVIWLVVCVIIGYDAVLLLEHASRWKADELLIARLNEARELRIGAPPHDLSSPSPTSDGLHFASCDGTGVDFPYENGAVGTFHLAETLGGGVAVTDFDRDGSTDMVFVNGGNFVNWPDQRAESIKVFQCVKSLRFREVSASARTMWAGFGHGCAVGDFDNDGFDDLFFTGYQSTLFFHNLGDGTFEEITDAAGVRMDRWCATAAFGDLDGDGDLDLYVTAYADVSRTEPPPYCELNGVRIHCHPHHYEAVDDMLFENLGDGTFADRSESSSIAMERQYGLGVVIVDLNQDRVPEIFVANDGDRNLLYEYRGGWRFEEIGVTAGIAYNSQGQSMGAMGIACADFDSNGLLDLMTTNFLNERNVIFSNQGNNTFFDRSRRSVMNDTSRPKVGWAAVPFDADCDGLLDLFVANGHVTEWPDAPYEQVPLLYRGQPNARWSVVGSAGEYFNRRWHGRGAVAADLTGDRLLDLVVCHIGAPASILKNDSDRRGGAITLELVGVRSNRSASTTEVELMAGGRRYVAQRMLSAGYLSSSSRAMHFGIGDAAAAESIVIRWQSGLTQILDDIPRDVELIVVEGRTPIIKP